MKIYYHHNKGNLKFHPKFHLSKEIWNQNSLPTPHLLQDRPFFS